MENFFSRYKNPLVLMAVLFVQVVYLATQIPVPSRNPNPAGSRLIRVWAVTAITPFERALVGTSHFFRNTWHDYIDLHNVRKQNRELQDEVARLRLEQLRLKTDADQNRRLQALLDFKERYIGQTVAAQVIGSSGSEQSHVIYIDKGSRAGVKQDMAVITPDGIVGKVRDVYPFSSQVLMINDRESGAGVILENSRLQGILRGKDMGELRVGDIMSDEKVEVGERVATSGGDRIYPKGLPVGTVTGVDADPDAGTFLSITVKPAANLDRLEEVLVITRIAEEAPAVSADTPARRAADVLAQRLPSVPKAQDTVTNSVAEKASGTANPAATPGATGAIKKQASPPTAQKKAVPGPDQAITPAGPALPEKPEKAPPEKPATPQPTPGDAEKPPR